MKTLGYIVSIIIMLLIVRSQAASQSRSSTTQTVYFAVSHSAKPAMSTLAGIQSINASSSSIEAAALENQIKQQSAKITVSASSGTVLAAPSNIYTDIHMNLISILESGKSLSTGMTPRVITITD
jgi:hypothetical protein